MTSQKYCDEEDKKLSKFRENISDLCLSPLQLVDEFLIKWLRARNLDLALAEKMLRDSLKWRADFKTDTILEEEFPEGLAKSEPLAYCGISKDGFAAFIQPFGRYDVKGAIEKYGPDLIERFHVEGAEFLNKLMKEESEKVGVSVTQSIQIFDMEGYSFRKFFCKACIEYFMRLSPIIESNYPEIMHYVMVINAPRFFNMMFSVIKPFMSKATLDKLEVFGCDKEKWRKVVREKFPVENIPPYWGGTLEGVDAYCSDSDIWIRAPKQKEIHSMMEGSHMIIE